MTFLQVFLAGAAAVILVTLISLRRAHIRVEYSVRWLAVGFVLLVCAAFPKWPLRVAAKMGLDPQTAFIILAGALVSALLFDVSIEVSRLREENVILTQRLAILEFHLNRESSPNGSQKDPSHDA